MIKGLAGGVALFLMSSVCHADIYTLDTDPSGTLGSSPFGTITTTVVGNNLDVTVDVSPNFDIDTGAHWALTMDLATGGLSITGLSAPFFQASGSSFANAPFSGPWNYAIGCSGGGQGQNSCGDTSMFSFVVNGAGALNPLIVDGVAFAVDIYDKQTGLTGVVGANPPSPVPGPIVGAGLPGIVAGCVGLLILGRRRYKAA